MKPTMKTLRANDTAQLGSSLANLASRIERVLVVCIAVSSLVFLFLPVLIVIPMSFSSAQSLQFPPPGLSLRWYAEFFQDAAWGASLANSLIVAVASSGLALVLGALAAYGLVRGNFFGRAALDANFLAPLIIPSIIMAVALYIAFAKVALLGTYLGLIIAHTLNSAPYVVLVMSVAMSSLDARIEQVARSLGASELTVVRRVVLPNLMPSVLAAWIFAFIVSFDEVILSLFLFGNKYTVPKQMFTRLELKIDPTITVVATMLIVVSAAAFGAAAWLTRRPGLFLPRL